MLILTNQHIPSQPNAPSMRSAARHSSWFLIFFLIFTLAFCSLSALATCSSFAGPTSGSMSTGKVVINEYNYAGNYVELKINDATLTGTPSNFSTWRLSVFNKSGNSINRRDFSIQSAYTSITGCGSTSSYIKIPVSSIGNDSVVVLWSDSAMTQEVDYFRIGQSAYPAFQSSTCFAPSEFPTASTVTWHQGALTGSASHKDIARAPDGAGKWIETPYNGSDQGTSCVSNDSTLAITKTLTSAAVVYVGEQVTFRLQVALDSRASTQTGVTANDLLPNGLTYVSHTATKGTYNSGTGVWSIGSLSAGGIATLDITAKVSLVGTLTNSATVISTDFPSDSISPANASITVLQPLSLTKSVSPATVPYNTAATYIVTVTNNSAAALPSAFTVNDNFTPTGLTVSTPTAAPGSSYSGGIWTINSGMAAGASKTLSIPVTSQTTEGSFTNTATAVAPFGGANLTASATLTVTAATMSSFSAYETSISNASAATTSNRIIQTRVASTSGNLCKADGTTCSLKIASFSSGGSVDTTYSGTVNASLEYCGTVNRSGSGITSTVSCLGNWTTLGGTKTVLLENGVGLVTFPFVNNAYEGVRVKITSATISSGPWYSDDYFAIRPSALTVTATDTTSSTAGSTRSLTTGANNTHKAGQHFTLNAEALATSATASNYRVNGTGPVTNSIDLTSPSGSSGAIKGTLILGTWSGVGTVTSNTATYTEVGSFTLTLEDQDYANIDKADGSSTIDRYFSGSTSISRFTPDHFQTTVAKACNTFTYSGQPFTVTVTSYNAFNMPTMNYGLTTNTVTLSDAGVTTFLSNNTIDSSSFGTSTGIASTTTPAYKFENATTEPTAIKVRATDLDNISSTGYETSASNMIYSGRARLFNAYGSELLDLPMLFTTQYWNGSGWILNTSDACTTGVNLSLTDVSATDGLETSEVCTWDSGNSGNSGLGCSSPPAAPSSKKFSEPPAAGNFNLNFKAPGTTNAGAVDVTATVPSWLQFNWTGATISNPKARATFGIYKTPIIYLRENY